MTPSLTETPAPATPSRTSQTGPAGGSHGGPGQELSRRGYLKAVLVLGSLTAIGPLTVDLYLPAMPALAADFGVSQSAVQATITGMLVGLAVGQVVVGPVSDAVGRRRPLLAGLALHVIASVLCALAPTVTLLTVARGLQGLAGAAVSVVLLAVVRDLYTGMAAATLFSRIMLVMGVVPVLAPSLGGLVLQLTSWRGVFVILAGAGVAGLVLATTSLRETLAPARRRPARPRAVLATYAGLLRDRTYVALVLLAGLVFATLFAYIAGVSFALQGVYGLSTGQFAVAFGVNAAGLVLATQANPALVRRFGPARVLHAALVVGAAGGVVLVLATVTGLGGLPLVLAGTWVLLAACGFSFPNTPALALSRHGEAAGTAAALLGGAQFLVGGLAAPLVGVLGERSAVPMAAVMAGGMLGAAVLGSYALRRAVGGGEPEVGELRAAEPAARHT